MGGVSVQMRMCMRVVVLLAIARFGLQSPTPRIAQEVRTTCPGYRSGSAAGRDMTGCETGTSVTVDHMTAFRFNSSHNPDWRSCILPHHELPEANHRVCFRTNVDKCGDEYRVFLKRRNLENLRRICPNDHEGEALRVGIENSTVQLQSPRYGCRKQRSGNLYAYRRSELCLYNVSIPRCESNTLTLERALDDIQELENRADDGECRDYLQFFYGSTKTKAYCGSELLSLELRLPATEFMAIFWTDPAENKLGFKLSARCHSFP